MQIRAGNALYYMYLQIKDQKRTKWMIIKHSFIDDIKLYTAIPQIKR